MDKLIDALDDKANQIWKIYFARLVRDYIVKNSDPQMNLEFLRDFMGLPWVEEVNKAMSDNEDSLIRFFDYLNGKSILNQEEDDNYPTMISSYDDLAFSRFMTSKNNDYEYCLMVICKIRKVDRLYACESKRIEYSPKNILTSLSVFKFMVDEKFHESSIELVNKMCKNRGSMFECNFKDMIKKYRMMLIQCLYNVTGSYGKMKNYINKISHYSPLKQDLHDSIVEEYLKIKEEDDNRIKKEENMKIIDATRPTLRDLDLAEKFEKGMSLRPIRDSRDEKALFRRMILFKINKWFEEKLKEFQEQEDKEFE